MTTNSAVAVCVLLLLLAVSRAAEGRPRGGGGARKIRHDHQSQDESGRSDADFEFETTVGWPPRRSTDGAAAEDYGDGAVEDVTLDVTHRLYDARRGIVPYIVYQGKTQRVYQWRVQDFPFFSVTLRSKFVYRAGRVETVT